MKGRRPESVLVLVYTRLADVLLMQRTDIPGYWQSITGGLEWGESAQQCAQRELFEETALMAVPHDEKHSCTFDITGPWRQRYHSMYTQNTEYLFSVCFSDKLNITVNAAEHTEYCWLSANEALNLASSPTNKEAIERIVLPLLSSG